MAMTDGSRSTRLACQRLSALMLLALVTLSIGVEGRLSAGYYRKSCPNAENIIRKGMAAALRRDRNTAAGVVRLHFHDCFVNGCDGSVLIDSANGVTAEKDGPGNANSLRGFEAVDSIKKDLEAACPGVVSCADILAYASRDGVVLTGGPSWTVEGGRRDGVRSLASDLAGNLLGPSSTLAQLTSGFARKGLSQDEMVTLSGAHTIGQSHCGNFASHINPANPDRTMDPSLARSLAQVCPAPAPTNVLVDMEPTATKFDTRYYSELLRNRGLFTSDQVLAADAVTRPAVQENAHTQAVFFRKFANAMVRMGQIEVLTGSRGQIRLNCRVANS